MLDDYLWQHVTSTGERQGTIEVSPELAPKILASAHPGPGKQRPITKLRVARYAADMGAGRWMDNAGGALLFDADGYFRGGQHRVSAQIISGRAVSYVIRWDQDEKEIAADNEGGAPWSAVDIAGGSAPNRQHRQAIATNLLILDHEQGLIGFQPSWNPGRLLVAEHVNDPRVARAAQYASAVRTTIAGVQGTSAGTMYAICSEIAPGVAPYFFESLRTGAGLFPLDPIHTLRNMLLGVSFRGYDKKKWQTMHVIARGWNHHVAGERVSKLQRYTPPTNNPVRPVGWRPFFAKDEA